MSKLLIEGATPRPPSGVASPVRLEIATFVKDIYQFTLFVLALQEIQGKFRKQSQEEEDVATYFNMSAIHGWPHKDWNQSPNPGGNFCAHGIPTFPTWHRPYMALFEQEIQRIAKMFALNFLQADTDPLPWQQAATTLRLPYWGWDKTETFVPPPEIIRNKEVEIMDIDGCTRVKTQNPFLYYRFPYGTADKLPSPYNKDEITLRHPKNGASDPDALENTLKAIRDQVVSDTAALAKLTTWEDFRVGKRNVTGFESIHGTIHVRTGGSNGHMTSVPVAAFDPIFWLHHAQVDRVLSIWYAKSKVWTDDKRDLTPFWRTQEAYWQSPEIADAEITFNYGYSETQSAASKTDNCASKEPSSSEGNSASDGPSAPGEPTLHELFSYPQPPVQTEASEPIAVLAEEESTILDWSGHISCKMFALGGSFSVVLFLGDVPEDPSEWLFDPGFAGTFDVFANSEPDQCENCNNIRDVEVFGYIHLNRPFLKRSNETTLEAEKVVPYLKDNLNWAVQKSDGTAANFTEIPSLQVTVQCTPQILPIGARIPTDGEPIFYHEITRGRPGGYRDA